MVDGPEVIIVLLGPVPALSRLRLSTTVHLAMTDSKQRSSQTPGHLSARRVAVLLAAASTLASLGLLAGCEERIVGARGIGAGYYKVQDGGSSSKDGGIYGEASMPNR